MKSMMTVVSVVNFAGHGPACPPVESRYEVPVQSEEQPYLRYFTVEEEAKFLDTGWVEDHSLLVVRNEEGKGLPTNPTDEERAALEERVVELYGGESVFRILIHPKRSVQLTLSCTKGLMMRCRKGSARITLAVFPA